MTFSFMLVSVNTQSYTKINNQICTVGKGFVTGNTTIPTAQKIRVLTGLREITLFL